MSPGGHIAPGLRGIYGPGKINKNCSASFSVFITLGIMERLIGKYAGKTRGPLFIAIAGMHGNEPAGVNAINLVLKMLEVEHIRNPAFDFVGKMVGFRGNLQALRKGVRYIDKDFNRLWTAENLAHVLAQDDQKLVHEDFELKHLFLAVQQAVKDYAPEEIYLIDLHTTTASGGIFSIPTEEEISKRLARALHAPVIEGFLTGIQGTTLHYFNSALFNIPMTAVCFESGQHDEPLSVNRAVAGLINCLRSIGCVKPDDVENQHDNILIEYSKGLPKMAKLIQVHDIQPGDQFEMIPNYKNFQPVMAGEVIAKDKNGIITVKKNGLLLMPLYQSMGDDGFFIIETIEGY